MIQVLSTKNGPTLGSGVYSMRLGGIPVNRHHHVRIRAHRLYQILLGGPVAGPVRAAGSGARVAAHRHQHHVGVIEGGRDGEGVMALKPAVDQFQAFALVVAAVGPTGSGDDEHGPTRRMPST